MKSVCIEITDKCPCKCVHCSSDYHANTSIPLDILQACIADFSSIGGKYLELSGGDPTEHDAFPDVLASSHQHIPHVTVFSNNIQYDNQYFVQLLKENNATLSFTILGCENTHNTLMGIPSYRKILDLYHLCKENSIRVEGHFVLMRPNMHDMEKVIATFPEIKILRLMPQGRAYDNWSELQLRDAELKYILPRIKKTGSHLTLPFCYQGRCNAGITQFTITPNGTVVPCASFKRSGIKLGNIYTDSLQQIFSDANERLRLWKVMKTAFVRNDPSISSQNLINPMCWGHYLHDGLKHPLAYDTLLQQFPTFDADFSRWISYPKTRIFISGAHGVGKSALISDAIDAMHVSYYENKAHNPYIDDVYQRQLWRLYKYKYDDEHIKTIATNVVLVNRCPLDWIVYTNAFRTMGWLSDHEHQQLMNRYHELFAGVYIPQHVCYINPDIHWSQDRIQERWKIDGKKWRETDDTYYRTIRGEYDRVLQSVKSVAHVIEVNITDRKQRVESLKREILSIIS